MKRNLLYIIILFACVLGARANDGVYFTSGSFLIPIEETSISVEKEILTITIGKDSMATVDVYYEFMNPDKAKTVTMAFEAASPYCTFRFNKNGVHPFIKDFTVEMNGKTLPYTNSLVASRMNEKYASDFTPLDPNKWKGYGEVPDSILPMDDALYNAELDSVTAYAYAYQFKANFNKGINKVHHTYKYMMSYSVGTAFEIPYWLTPATRWANHQIDDFTLRIKNERLGDEFCMVDTLFTSAPFKFVDDWGVKYQCKAFDGEHILLAQMGDNATLEWHSRNFRPTSDISITSAEKYNYSQSAMFGYTSGKVVLDKDGNEQGRYIGDTGDSLLVIAQDYGLVSKKTCKVVEYNAENGQGWLVIRNDEGKSVNIREAMSTKSKKLCTIRDEEGDLPTAYRCLGMKSVMNPDKGFYEQWFKINVDGTIGYVRADLMRWDSINTY